MQIFVYIVLGLFVLVFIWQMRKAMKKSNAALLLVQRYADDVENPALIDELYAFTQRDPKLASLVREHQATKEDFAQILQKLLVWGNFKKGKRFVPIDSFLYRGSLETLLKHKDEEAKALTMRMMNFFRI